jgi:hypothetical protein
MQKSGTRIYRAVRWVKTPPTAQQSHPFRRDLLEFQRVGVAWLSLQCPQ